MTEYTDQQLQDLTQLCLKNYRDWQKEEYDYYEMEHDWNLMVTDVGYLEKNDEDIKWEYQGKWVVNFFNYNNRNEVLTDKPTILNSKNMSFNDYLNSESLSQALTFYGPRRNSTYRELLEEHLKDQIGYPDDDENFDENLENFNDFIEDIFDNCQNNEIVT